MLVLLVIKKQSLIRCPNALIPLPLPLGDLIAPALPIALAVLVWVLVQKPVRPVLFHFRVCVRVERGRRRGGAHCGSHYSVRGAWGAGIGGFVGAVGAVEEMGAAAAAGGRWEGGFCGGGGAGGGEGGGDHCVGEGVDGEGGDNAVGEDFFSLPYIADGVGAFASAEGWGGPRGRLCRPV